MKITKVDDWRLPMYGWSSVGVGAIPLAEQLDHFRKLSFSDVIFNFSKLYGYAPDTLDWVQSVPELEGVALNSLYDDASYIDQLPNIRAFSDNSEGRVDFSFRHIYECQHLNFEYRKAHPRYERFHNAVSFCVSNLPARYKDLVNLPTVSLRYLSLKKAKLCSLKGLGQMKNLEVLRLQSSKQLTLETLDEAPESIKLIDIYGCRSISQLSFLDGLENLEEVYLKGCGEIDSLQPLKCAKRLRRLYIDNTQIKEKPTKSLLETFDQLSSSDRKYLENLP